MSQHKPRKRFGQNFLVDQNIISQIIQAIAPLKQQHIVEIGPGQAALTEELISVCDNLQVIEIDRDLVAQLQQQWPELIIHEQDILTVDLANLVNNKGKLRLVGNLPYNISTPLLMHVFSYLDYLEDMHFMLQYEVADRLLAQPNSKSYGRLSIITQYLGQATLLFKVPPAAFYPQPKVDSAIIKLVPHINKPFPEISIEKLSLVVKQAFSQRRKKLANNLKSMFSNEELLALDIEPTARAENLTVEQFVILAGAL